MSVAKTFPSDTAAHVRPSGRGPIPVPHEHGSWVVLYAPLLIGLLAGGRPSPAAAILLTLAATGAFLARNAAGLLVRGRGEADTPLWLALFSTLFGLTCSF